MIFHSKPFHLLILTNGPDPAGPNQRDHCTHGAHEREHPCAHAQMHAGEHAHALIADPPHHPFLTDEFGKDQNLIAQ